MTVPARPRQLYLIDTSAQARSQHPAVRDIIAGLIADRAASTCVTVDMEAVYSGRDLADAREIALRRRELYVVLHYEADFEHIAATTSQPHRWIAPRGTLS